MEFVRLPKNSICGWLWATTIPFPSKPKKAFGWPNPVVSGKNVCPASGDHCGPFGPPNEKIEFGVLGSAIMTPAPGIGVHVAPRSVDFALLIYRGRGHIGIEGDNA